MWDEIPTQANHASRCIYVIEEFKEKVWCVSEGVVAWGFFGRVEFLVCVGFFNSVTDMGV